MNYKDSKKAIKSHVNPKWQKTMQELLQTGGAFCPADHTRSLNDFRAKWISESGLFELAISSKLPAARAFRKWVFGEVLPSIRKTGFYSCTLRCSCCKADRHMAGQALGGQGADEAEEHQPTAADCWWVWADRSQAVCNSSQSYQPGGAGVHKDNDPVQKVAAAATAHQHPILDMQGQVTRCYAETCLQKFVSDNLQRLTGLTEADLIKEFIQQKLNLRQGFVSTGVGDLQTQGQYTRKSSASHPPQHHYCKPSTPCEP
ncbi:TPA: hypothetical protein ACH3X1_012515 [Trebouxia sp. C0004]